MYNTKDNFSKKPSFSHSDVINILLISLILVFAVSKLSQEKINAILNTINYSVTKSDGTEANKNSLNSLTSSQNSSNNALNINKKTSIQAKSNNSNSFNSLKSMNSAKTNIINLLNKSHLNNSIKVIDESRGIKISLSNKYLFDKEYSQIRQQAKPVLKSIGIILRNLPGHYFRVEGHTDSEDICTKQIPSNWELSTLRASAVLRFLIDKANMNPQTMSTVGYGEYRPLKPNTNAQNMAKNRRVDIVIINSELVESKSN